MPFDAELVKGMGDDELRKRMRGEERSAENLQQNLQQIGTEFLVGKLDKKRACSKQIVHSLGLFKTHLRFHPECFIPPEAGLDQVDKVSLFITINDFDWSKSSNAPDCTGEVSDQTTRDISELHCQYFWGVSHDEFAAFLQEHEEYTMQKKDDDGRKHMVEEIFTMCVSKTATKTMKIVMIRSFNFLMQSKKFQNILIILFRFFLIWMQKRRSRLRKVTTRTGLGSSSYRIWLSLCYSTGSTSWNRRDSQN